MLTDLDGQIERITYINEENGFTIARVKVHGQKELVTVVGNFLSPCPGEIIKMRGEWTTHDKYGDQFKVVNYNIELPATVFGIRKYLGSGLIKGIGPVMASRIVKKFGEDTLEIIDSNIEKLSMVEGIGKKRIAMIAQAWKEQEEIRNVMLFLQTHDVSTGYATKIFKHYGDRSIDVVTKNPYRLATDIFGIGFLTADRIAQKLGFEKDSPLRIGAGIIYVLNQLSDDGHVYYPLEALVEKCTEILQVPSDTVGKSINDIAAEKKIVIEDNQKDKPVYLAKYYLCETGVAALFKRLVCMSKFIREIKTDKAVEWVQKQLSISLDEKQIEAVRCSHSSKAMVITGGPGTGKTTVINAILKVFSKVTNKIMLAAPTGRAAKRMSEATGGNAKTIHRLLEYSIAGGGFQKNDKKPLNCDILIVDEASMIDTVMMYHLLKAIPAGAVFILVGDVNQLPSVGPGNILKDIILSNIMPVVLLTEIFRQAKKSMIIVNSHRINDGVMPFLKKSGNNDDFYFIEQQDPEKVLTIILELVKTRIPDNFGLDPSADIQVLTPMHKGMVGAGNLNVQLQQALNPAGEQVLSGNRIFRCNDRVMQIKNNYDKDVFNGDIGRILGISKEYQEVIVSFDGKNVSYGFTDLDEIVLAYAISVHKSQGSEYPAVVIPILTQHYILLQRNLIYTAITRGSRLVVIVGTRQALAIGINNNKIQKRYTLLEKRLV
jgi:exodeoxyribonuclease V alpha subunit